MKKPHYTTHTLKTDSKSFGTIFSGSKKMEIRFDDRGFSFGDVLHLRETYHTGTEMTQSAELVYTGQECWCKVSHILRGPVHGLADGWVILSIENVITN